MIIRGYLNKFGTEKITEKSGRRTIHGLPVYEDTVLGLGNFVKINLAMHEKLKGDGALGIIETCIKLFTIHEWFDCEAGRKQGNYELPNDDKTQATLNRIDGVYELLVYSPSLTRLYTLYCEIREGSLMPVVSYEDGQTAS